MLCTSRFVPRTKLHANAQNPGYQNFFTLSLRHLSCDAMDASSAPHTPPSHPNALKASTPTLHLYTPISYLRPPSPLNPSTLLHPRKLSLISRHTPSIPSAPPHTHTKCPGSKKFATPSLTAYSCPQHPHTSLPSCIHVSSNTRCKSTAV